MVLAQIESSWSGDTAPLEAAHIADALRRRLPAGVPAEEHDLVLAQVIGHIRDLAERGELLASADYKLVLGTDPGAPDAVLAEVPARSVDATVRPCLPSHSS